MATKQSRNVEALEQLYAAFNRGDIETVLEAMADDITWVEPAGNPEGGTYHGPDDVLENVFGELTEAFEHFSVDPKGFIDGGDDVAVEGTFKITSNTGDDFEIPFAHLWEMEDGELQRFTNYTDTVLMQRAFEP